MLRLPLALCLLVAVAALCSCAVRSSDGPQTQASSLVISSSAVVPQTDAPMDPETGLTARTDPSFSQGFWYPDTVLSGAR